MILVPTVTLEAEAESVIVVAVVLAEEPLLLATEQPIDKSEIIASPARGAVDINLLGFKNTLLDVIRFFN